MAIVKFSLVAAVVHAPEDRPARSSGASSSSGSSPPSSSTRCCSALHGFRELTTRPMPLASPSRLDGPPRRLAARRAAGRRVRRRDRRASGRGSRPAGRWSRGSRSSASSSACSRCGSRPTGRSTTSPRVTMYSMHMVQHLMFSMLAAPLLLLGTPAWLLRWILQPAAPAARGALARAVRPRAGRLQRRARAHALAGDREREPALGPLHFSLHALLFVSSLIVWLPVLSPLPEMPRSPPLMRSSTCSPGRSCRPFPRRSSPSARRRSTSSTSTCRSCSASTTLEDQQIAGLIMKIGAGLLLWVIIAVIFFRWAAEEEQRTRLAVGSTSSIVSSPRWA